MSEKMSDMSDRMSQEETPSPAMCREAGVKLREVVCCW